MVLLPKHQAPSRQCHGHIGRHFCGHHRGHYRRHQRRTSAGTSACTTMRTAVVTTTCNTGVQFVVLDKPWHVELWRSRCCCLVPPSLQALEGRQPDQSCLAIGHFPCFPNAHWNNHRQSWPSSFHNHWPLNRSAASGHVLRDLGNTCVHYRGHYCFATSAQH